MAKELSKESIERIRQEAIRLFPTSSPRDGTKGIVEISKADYLAGEKQDIYESGATTYALKSVELVEAKDKRIKELDDSYQHQSKLLYKKDTDLMIAVDRIEQLKKLIEKAHEAGYNDYEKYTLFLSWLGFKTDNNL